MNHEDPKDAKEEEEKQEIPLGTSSR